MSTGPETMQSPTIGQLAAALAIAQGKIEGAKKDATNPHLRNKYADLASCWDACRAPLAENGIAIVQRPVVVGATGNGDPVLEMDTTVAHASGEWMSSRVPVIFARDEKGLKPMQCLGSALTYARRYGLMSIVGICPEEDDGDGAGHGRYRDAAPAPREEYANGNGHAAPKYDGPPTSGKGLFAWLKSEGKTCGKDLIVWAQKWGKAKDAPQLFSDWTPEMVRACHAAVCRKLATADASPAEPREPGSDG